MRKELLENQPFSQRTRLEFVDFLFEFYGKVSRQLVSECLNLATASATRDIALYRQIAPENSILRHHDKCHYRTEKFQPVFAHDTRTAFANLALISELVENQLVTIPAKVGLQFDTKLVYPRSDITASISRAIFNRKSVCIKYESLSDGPSKRTIIPHAIFEGHRGWYTRAFDTHSSQFSDFSLSLIRSVVVQQTVENNLENSLEDSSWNTKVTLTLYPHPLVKNARAVELMYRMQDGCLNIQTNVVIASHILRRENVVVDNNSSNVSQQLLCIKGSLGIDNQLDEI